MKQSTLYTPSTWSSTPIPDVPDLSLQQARSDVLQTLLRVAWPTVTALVVLASGVALYFEDWIGAGSYLVAWGVFTAIFRWRRHPRQRLLAALVVVLTGTVGISLLLNHLAPLGILWLSCVPLMTALLLGKRATVASVGIIALCIYLVAGTLGLSLRVQRFEHLPLLVWGLLALNFVALYGPVALAAARLLRRFDAALSETRAIHAQTQKLAHTDGLTGLPNLYALRRELELVLNATAAGAPPPMLLFLDLDHLRRINDLHGHMVGDAYIIEIARRLQTLVAPPSLVCRSGGAEFIVLAHLIPPDDPAQRHDAALNWTTRLRQSVQSPVRLPGLGELKTNVNIGVSLLDTTDLSVESALQEAAIALSHTKAAGRNQVAIYQRQMLRELMDQVQLEHDFELALQSGQLTIAVQPQVDRHGRLMGAELLSRWTDPVRGPVSPALFIPAAEKTGLIVPLGDWVLAQACELALALMARQIDIPLSVNVSLRQLEDPGFETRLHHLLGRTGVPTSRLMLEITESVLLSDQVDVLGMLNRLAQAGLQFSVDDFGTGYSSLSYLKRLPLSELKIDQSFVANLPDDPNDGTLVSIMVVLAETLDLRLVAEGIETPAQVEFLSHMGCHIFQGYHFARPMPASQWLDQLDATCPHTDDRTG